MNKIWPFFEFKYRWYNNKYNDNELEVPANESYIES